MGKNATPGKTITLRLKPEELRRFDLVVIRIRGRERGEIHETKVIKELLGLLPPNLVTEEDRRILSHGTDAPIALPDQLPKVGRADKRER